MANIGDVVQLKSGGPTMTVTARNSGDLVIGLYHNTISGKLEEFRIPMACLKFPYLQPENPTDAARLRGTSITDR